MGLFGKNWKGKDGPDYIGGNSEGDKSNQWEQYQETGEEKRRVFGIGSGRALAGSTVEGFEAPPGPPPGHRGDHEEEEFAPPPGPPPGRSEAANPPPYHDWTVIPDTALLPPPPTVRHERSVNNSSEEDAVRAHNWCDHNPLFTPVTPHATLQGAVRNGEVNLIRPREFHGELSLDKFKIWKGRTHGTRDAILITAVPLYFAAVDSPLQTGLAKTIYYEVKMLRIGGRHTADSGLAMGYCAQPYPSWRLPGHERASLGVHGDDGRRFINDSYGGLDFTEPFREGEILGIGLKFTTAAGPRGTGQDVAVEVFFTRDGERKGGWSLDEERDESAGDVRGLEGKWDLYGAIGVFGNVEFEVRFARESWLYRPR